MSDISIVSSRLHDALLVKDDVYHHKINTFLVHCATQSDLLQYLRTSSHTPVYHSFSALFIHSCSTRNANDFFCFCHFTHFTSAITLNNSYIAFCITPTYGSSFATPSHVSAMRAYHYVLFYSFLFVSLQILYLQ